MKRLLTAGLVVTALGISALLVATSGVIPVRASADHWGITAWFLSYSMQRSVSTWSLGIEVPALDEPGLVLKGAGHYHTGCRPCHGSPELKNPRVAQAMLPSPPYLPPKIAHWRPEELFSITKHGIKFTGMPAWPALQRDDEIWAVVAFLLTLPELDAETYQRLIYGEAKERSHAVPFSDLSGRQETLAGSAQVNCGRCHGEDGNGRGANVSPKLAGQRPSYLYATLQAYAQGTRYSGMMGPIAASLTVEELREFARYYADQDALTPAPVRQDLLSAIKRGESIARDGIPSQRVPACSKCHGPGDHVRNPTYPLLAGQYADYLILQLELFKKEHRGGTAYAHLMRPVATRLTAEQRHDVAQYYASLRPAPEGGAKLKIGLLSLPIQTR